MLQATSYKLQPGSGPLLQFQSAAAHLHKTLVLPRRFHIPLHATQSGGDYAFTCYLSFKADLGSEDPDGGQDSTVSVFSKDAENNVQHRYTAHPRMAPDTKERGIDLLAPVWHIMDLTPQGRGDWYPSLAYGTKPPK